MKRRFIKGLSVATALCLSVSNPVATIAQETSNVTAENNSHKSSTIRFHYNYDAEHEYAVENSESGKTVSNEKPINSDDSGIHAKNGSTVNQKGDINVKEEAINIEDGSEVNVTGNINSTNNNVYKNENEVGAVVVDDGKATITGDINVKKEGKVDVRSYGVDARCDDPNKETSLTINGDIKVSSKASEDSTLTKNDNDYGYISANSDGIYAFARGGDGATKITVNGNVTATAETETEYNEGISSGINIYKNSGLTEIRVNGDVSSDTNGLSIYGNDGIINVIIDGTLKGKESAIDFSTATEFAYSENRYKKYVDPDAEKHEYGYLYDSEQNITVWKLESDSENLVASKHIDETTTIEEEPGLYRASRTFSKARACLDINYIIRTDEVSHGTIKLSGVKVIEGFNTAKESQIVTINVETAEGYKLDSVKNGNSILTRNADGSYNLVVPRGGGVQLSAVLSAIQKNNEASSNGLGSSSSSSGRSSGGSGSSSGSGSISIPTVTDTNAATDTTTTTTTSTSGATVTTTTSQSEGNSFVSSSISIGDKTANVSVSSSSVNGQDIVIKTVEGDISGVTFEGVGTVSADGTKVTTKDGEYPVVSAPMLFISTVERTGCFVDLNTGKPIATGKIEKFYQLGEDGQLHDHWVDTTGHFYFGPEDMKHYYGAPAELSNYEDGFYCLFNREGTFLGVRSGKWDDLWKICNEG